MDIISFLARRSIVLLFLFLVVFVNAQESDNEKRQYPPILAFTFTYNVQQPVGLLAKRFGTNFEVSLGTHYITKNNYIFGGDYHYLFGPTVKEDVLATLRNSNGDIIGNDGDYALLAIRQRGFRFGGLFGKIIPFNPKKSRSGLRVTIGGYFIEHKIRITNDAQNTPQLKDDYLKGYDRLTNGFAISEFVGYQYFSKNRLINGFIGIEAIQGFTKNRRAWDFDLMQASNENRLDLSFGLKIGWLLPLFQDKSENIYYY